MMLDQLPGRMSTIAGFLTDGSHYQVAARQAAVARIADLKSEMRDARKRGDTARADAFAEMHRLACASLQQTDNPGVPGWLQVERERAFYQGDA